LTVQLDLRHGLAGIGPPRHAVVVHLAVAVVIATVASLWRAWIDGRAGVVAVLAPAIHPAHRGCCVAVAVLVNVFGDAHHGGHVASVLGAGIAVVAVAL